MTDFTATVAAEPATRRRGWPLLVLLHAVLWTVFFGILFVAGDRGAGDINPPATGLGAAALHAAGWVRSFWYYALFGLGFWTAIDGLVMLVLSRDPRGRGYRFWNLGQFLLAAAAIGLTLVALGMAGGLSG